jgi:hypothetical protein
MPYATGRGGSGNIQDSTTLTSEYNNTRDQIPHQQQVTPQQRQQQQRQHQPQQHLDQHSQNEKKVFYSTGRGGAGNIKSSDSIPSPNLAPHGSNTPQLYGDTITTGRGGYGNMVKNSDPELVRKLQDVDTKPKRDIENELQQVTSNKSFSVGRGGFGNVISQTRSRTSQTSGKSSENQPGSLIAITSQGNKITEEEEEAQYDAGNLENSKGKKSFIRKLKGLFQ